jgi:hypothetical protein
MKLFVISLRSFTNIAVRYFQIGQASYCHTLRYSSSEHLAPYCFTSFYSFDSLRLHFCPTATAVGPILQCPMRDEYIWKSIGIINDRGWRKYSENKLSQGNYVHRNFNMACPRNDTRPAGWQALGMRRTSKQLVHSPSSWHIVKEGKSKAAPVHNVKEYGYLGTRWK